MVNKRNIKAEMSFSDQQPNTNRYRFIAPMAHMTPSPDTSTNETNDTNSSPTQQPTNRHFNGSISLVMNESLNQTTNSPTRQPSLDFSSPFFPPVAPVAPTHQSSPDFSSPFLPPLASTPTPIPTPAPPPPPPPPTTTNTLNTNLQSNILTYVLQSNPLLIPTTLSRNARLTSTRINDIAHAMWNVAFTHDDPLQRACQYAAMFSPLKLAALAKLNFLPSWWFFRDLALKGLQERGWEVDDAEMEETWEEAVRWCVEVNGRKGGK